MSPRRLDLDELALLEEERDHLLTSIEDLDREHAAGDMDDVDHRTLREDYTRRAATVLAAIDEQRSLLAEVPRANRGRTIAVTALVVVAAVGAGLFVARSAGQRGDGPITGAVNTTRAQLATCQEASMRDPEGGVECYDEILAESPDNVEALTYRGWALIRSDQPGEGAADLARAVEVDPDYPDARAFRAVVAARAGDHQLAAREIDRFYRNSPSPAAVSVLQSQGIEREVFVATIGEATRRCWQEAATGQDPEETDATRFLGDLSECLETVLAEDPGDVDALVSAAYASVDATTTDLTPALELAERAVSADPADPNALLVRATLLLALQRPDAAAEDLERLEQLPRPTASFLFGGPEQLREALGSGPSDGARDQAGSPSTSSAPTTVVGADPRIPNPGGG